MPPRKSVQIQVRASSSSSTRSRNRSSSARSAASRNDAFFKALAAARTGAPIPKVQLTSRQTAALARAQAQASSQQQLALRQQPSRSSGTRQIQQSRNKKQSNSSNNNRQLAFGASASSRGAKTHPNAYNFAFASACSNHLPVPRPFVSGSAHGGERYTMVSGRALHSGAVPAGHYRVFILDPYSDAPIWYMDNKAASGWWSGSKNLTVKTVGEDRSLASILATELGGASNEGYFHKAPWVTASPFDFHRDADAYNTSDVSGTAISDGVVISQAHETAYDYADPGVSPHLAQLAAGKITLDASVPYNGIARVQAFSPTSIPDQAGLGAEQHLYEILPAAIAGRGFPEHLKGTFNFARDAVAITPSSLADRCMNPILMTGSTPTASMHAHLWCQPDVSWRGVGTLADPNITDTAFSNVRYNLEPATNVWHRMQRGYLIIYNDNLAATNINVSYTLQFNARYYVIVPSDDGDRTVSLLSSNLRSSLPPLMPNPYVPGLSGSVPPPLVGPASSMGPQAIERHVSQFVGPAAGRAAANPQIGLHVASQHVQPASNESRLDRVVDAVGNAAGSLFNAVVNGVTGPLARAAESKAASFFGQSAVRGVASDALLLM